MNIKSGKYIACIITFNPDIQIFEKCLCSVARQINEIIVWDNNSNNIYEIEKIIRKTQHDSIKLWKHRKNYGIAKSLNKIFDFARQKQCEWVLTLDQDSIVPDNMMRNYLKYSDYPNIGIVGCRTPDRNVESELFKGPAVDMVNELITSGSLTNVDAWKRINGFDEKLFIDSVDKDFCINLMRHGYTLLRVNNVVMSHTIGNIKNIKIGRFSILIYNHSSFRKYYQIRNMFYLDRKYKKVLSFFAMRHFVVGICKIMLFETDKIQKIMACFRGMVDGIRL